MPSEEEGFPRVLLEAMALGIPYVASDVGAVKDITPIEADEYVVPSGDVSGFVDKIDELIGLSQSEKNTLVAAFSKCVARYDLPVVAEDFKKLFIERAKK